MKCSLLIGALATGLILGASGTQAQDFYWVPTSGTNNWSDTANWLEGSTPTAGANIFFTNFLGAGSVVVISNSVQSVPVMANVIVEGSGTNRFANWLNSQNANVMHWVITNSFVVGTNAASNVQVLVGGSSAFRFSSLAITNAAQNALLYPDFRYWRGISVFFGGVEHRNPSGFQPFGQPNSV